MTRTAFLLLAVAACTPYEPDLPPSPFLCGMAEPKCPDGFACVAGKCTSGGAPDDAHHDGSGSGGPCTMTFTGELAQYVLTGAQGSQPSTGSTKTAPGVTAAPISRSANLMATPGADSINSSNWPTSPQVDPTSFYTLSLTAPAGCTLMLTGLSIDVRSSTTGPSSAAAGTSADGFTATTSIDTTMPSTPALSATGATLEVRIFGFAATASTGTMRVQDTMSVTGSVAAP